MPNNKQPKCKKCWDKGYSTELVANTSIPDFGGIRINSQVREIKNYCSCAKGKKLKKQDYAKQ
jgi:hypothetical protein